MALVRCEVCGRKTNAGVFCEKCGAELPQTESPPEVPEFVAKVEEAGEHPPAQLENDLEDLDDGLSTISMDSTMFLKPQSVPPAQEAPLPPPSSGGCSLIRVEQDQSRVFVVGQTMNFRFALTPLVDGLSDVFVAVVFEGKKRKEEVCRLSWVPRKGERRELKNINFAPPEAGALGFSFYFGFKQSEEDFVFEADGEYKVWPARARTEDVVRNIEINIQNSGHATDFNLSGLKDQLHSKERLEDVIDNLHGVQPIWSGMPLYQSRWKPSASRRKSVEVELLLPQELSSSPPASACLSALTLRIDQRRVLLLSEKQVGLGKNRKNRIVTRLFQDGVAKRHLNAPISRYHCTIDCEGRCFSIVDQGLSPEYTNSPSAYGVFLDGKYLSRGGKKELSAKKTTIISLAGSDAQDAETFSLEAEPWVCPSTWRKACGRHCKRRKASAFILRRGDAIPETYILLSDCIALRDADPDFDGIVVWREERGFGYATAETEGWLEPGMTLQLPQCKVEVEEWNQFGI